MRMRSQVLSSSLLMIMCGVVDSAFAQAWVDDPNTLSVGLLYTFSPASKIVETGGASLDGRKNMHHSMIFNAEYSTPLPGLAIDASLTTLGLQTAEDTAGTRHGVYDDGEFHVTLQDVRFGARYMLPIEEILALSFHVGGTIPTHDYEVLGFSAAGRGLKQLHLGLSVGRTFEPLLPYLYVHLRYEFTLSERFKTEFEETGAVDQNRSDLNFQVGYFIIPELEVNAAFDMRLNHGGINFIDYPTLSAVEKNLHDPLLKERIFLVGGGLSYAIVEGLKVNALFRVFVAGANTRNGHLFGAGLSWTIF